MNNQEKNQSAWPLGMIVGLVVLVLVACSGSSNQNTAQALTPATATPVVYSTSPASVDTTQSQLSNSNYYTNSEGTTVHAPAYSNSAPAGASAQCSDGTYSFSTHRSGTCSHHGGVATWL